MGSTILLADKSITIQKIVELTFADDAYVIKSYSDGEAALAAVPQLRPDLILADISLPLKSGYDLCQIIRNDPQYSDFSGIPVVLLAGIYETMDEERARSVEERAQQAGATEVLSKPFDPQVLTAKVKEYLRHAYTPEVDTEAPTLIEQAPHAASPNLFTESFKLPSAGSFTDEEAPEDDSERTMMLPRAGGPDSNLFADSLTVNEPLAETSPHAPIDIGSISPANEPVFEEDQEFSESAESVNAVPVEPPTEPAIPYLQSMSEEEPPTIILPATEEPFGDVFEEPVAAAQWSAPPVTEEEAPFGNPEPVVAAVVEQKPVEAEIPSVSPVLAEEMSMEPEEAIEQMIINEPGAPTVMEEAALSGADDSYDDTWPGVIMSSGQPVEELFEVEPAPVQFAKQEAAAETPAVAVEMPAKAEAGSNSRPVDITDELVDKIAERVVTKLSERLVSEIVWQVVPDLAERMIRRELEKLHASEE